MEPNKINGTPIQGKEDKRKNEENPFWDNSLRLGKTLLQFSSTWKQQIYSSACRTPLLFIDIWADANSTGSRLLVGFKNNSLRFIVMKLWLIESVYFHQQSSKNVNQILYYVNRIILFIIITTTRNMYGHVLYFIFPAIGGAVHINSIGQFWPVLASFGARSVSLIIKKKNTFSGLRWRNHV